MIDMIKVYNLEKIKLPNINAVLISNLGVFGMKGQIQTFNGTFEWEIRFIMFHTSTYMFISIDYVNIFFPGV